MRDIVLVLSGIVFAIIAIHIPEKSWNKDQPTDYSDTLSIAYHGENRCRSTGNFFDIDISVEYPGVQDNFVGQWIPAKDSIKLILGNGTDIDTIAHEVHHMVETMMKRYGVKDDHYAAYLQGSFTRCIWEIVEHDLNIINH